jgi:hypothetical protein
MNNQDQEAEIRIDRIRVGGGIGAAIVIVVLVGAMALDLPSLRTPVVVGILGGVIVGAALIAWHRRPSS